MKRTQPGSDIIGKKVSMEVGPGRDRVIYTKLVGEPARKLTVKEIWRLVTEEVNYRVCIV
jgi:hypothetical protein